MNSEFEKVQRKFDALRGTLTERARRLWAGAEADVLGRGGLALVAKATGMAISTVTLGRNEVRGGVRTDVLRDRRAGGGRRRLEKKDPGLIPALEVLVNPTTRGDPQNPLRWTCKSLRVLARELTAGKHAVGPNKVGELLRAAGYSLQAAAKTKEGVDHPDRNTQFEFINQRAKDFASRGLPVISVDSKKKEVVGLHANGAREWQVKGQPLEVMSHEYFDSNAPKATPYGVYDVAKNVAFVNVGTNNNTPTFAVRSIEKWWLQMGAGLYPDAKDIFITADGGGSNSSRSNVWKADLQEVADRTGLSIHVSHFPPGTSKWNKIEHRLFSFITLNWRGRPLVSYETIVSLIAATTTSKGLKVTAELDTSEYALGRRMRLPEMGLIHLERAIFHGDWNYILRPRTEAELAASRTRVAKTAPISHVERAARWKKLIVEQRRSGLSQRQFCRERGIARNAFGDAARRIAGKIRFDHEDAE